MSRFVVRGAVSASILILLFVYFNYVITVNMRNVPESNIEIRRSRMYRKQTTAKIKYTGYDRAGRRLNHFYLLGDLVHKI
jgi:hypothetical protein